MTSTLAVVASRTNGVRAQSNETKGGKISGATSGTLVVSDHGPSTGEVGDVSCGLQGVRPQDPGRRLLLEAIGASKSHSRRGGTQEDVCHGEASSSKGGVLVAPVAVLGKSVQHAAKDATYAGAELCHELGEVAWPM